MNTDIKEYMAYLEQDYWFIDMSPARHASAFINPWIAIGDGEMAITSLYRKGERSLNDLKYRHAMRLCHARAALKPRLPA